MLSPLPPPPRETRDGGEGVDVKNRNIDFEWNGVVGGWVVVVGWAGIGVGDGEAGVGWQSKKNAGRDASIEGGVNLSKVGMNQSKPSI